MVRKHTHSRMGSRGTIRSRSRRKIGENELRDRMGLLSIHRYAVWTEECASYLFAHRCGCVQRIHPQVLGGLSG